MQLFCMKCKAKRDVHDEAKSMTKNNRPILKAKCDTCNTTCCQLIKKE